MALGRRRVFANPAEAGRPDVMKIARPLTYSFGLSTALLGLWAVHVGGWWLLSVPLYVFVVVPLADALGGLDHDDIEPENAARIWRSWRYDVWLWLWVPVQLVLIGLGILRATSTPVLSPSFLGLTVAVGFVTGLGINVAHELMHRKGRTERVLAEVLMTSVTYSHFCVEHVLGHHRWVATPHDPASSRRGEVLYMFLPRTIFGGLVSAWWQETARVKKLGIPRFSPRDRRVRYPFVLAIFYVTLFALLGGEATLFFFAQGAVAVLLLETINYIEHYGLSRREIEPGRYEPCKPAHSWNSAHRVTNCLLFNLPRHADHHHLASRPFFSLRDIEHSPQLPAGYATMVLCSLVPPLFRAVMDPRVDDWNRRINRTYEESGRAPPGTDDVGGPAEAA